MMTTPLPLLPPSIMEMMLRSSSMGRKAHHPLRARQGTMRQHRTRPSSLSRHGLLLTMEPAGTPLLKTYTALDPVTLGEHIQVDPLTSCTTAADWLVKFSVCWAAACLLHCLHSCPCMLCLMSVTYMATGSACSPACARFFSQFMCVRPSEHHTLHHNKSQPTSGLT